MRGPLRGQSARLRATIGLYSNRDVLTTWISNYLHRSRERRFADCESTCSSLTAAGHHPAEDAEANADACHRHCEDTSAHGR